MTLPDHIPAPGETFNFARHLLALNAGRPDKAALSARPALAASRCWAKLKVSGGAETSAATVLVMGVSWSSGG